MIFFLNFLGVPLLFTIAIMMNVWGIVVDGAGAYRAIILTFCSLMLINHWIWQLVLAIRSRQ